MHGKLIKMMNFVLGNKCERLLNLHDKGMGQRVPDRNQTHGLRNTGVW